MIQHTNVPGDAGTKNMQKQMAQLMQKMIEDLGMDVDEILSNQDTSSILDWLRTNVHQRGMLYTPSQLIEVVTGKPPDPEPFLSYVERKYGTIHGF